MPSPPDEQNRENLPTQIDGVSEEVERSQSVRETTPGGLLGLLLWPVQAALAFGLQLAGNLIAGIVNNLLGTTTASAEAAAIKEE